MTSDGITVTSFGSVSEVVFNALKTSDGRGYTCRGSLESPALDSPLTVEENGLQQVVVQSEFEI